MSKMYFFPAKITFYCCATKFTTKDKYQDRCFHWRRTQLCPSNRGQTATLQRCAPSRSCKRRASPWWTDRERLMPGTFPVWVTRTRRHPDRSDVLIRNAHYDWLQLGLRKMARFREVKVFGYQRLQCLRKQVPQAMVTFQTGYADTLRANGYGTLDRLSHGCAVIS